MVIAASPTTVEMPKSSTMAPAPVSMMLPGVMSR
jgi:hypothetical protein